MDKVPPKKRRQCEYGSACLVHFIPTPFQTALLQLNKQMNCNYIPDRYLKVQTGVSQPPGPGINYIGPREILLELITNLNVILYLSTCHTVHRSVLIIFMIMP
jgi:hypothetical protein